MVQRSKSIGDCEARYYLAFKVPVLSNVFDLACYTGIAAAKQVVWEGAGAISNGPAEP